MWILADWFGFEGADRSLTVFGIKLIGINAANAHKLLLTLGVIATVLVINWVVHGLMLLLRDKAQKQWAFWSQQGLRMLSALVLLVGFLSIWFNDSGRLSTFLGLVTAGLAFALQRVVTAFAGYLIILRGNTFSVGDRIMMGGVRGDVIKLGFTQTTIMEMGQAHGEQADSPGMWVHARQYTGRIVVVTNDKIFDDPIYNYTKEFPYIWEELNVPISYKDDRKRAEEIILSAAKELTVNTADLGEKDIREMERRYVINRSELKPRIYMRLTDNWVDLTVRFICLDHGIRDVKDHMSRRIIDELDKAKIGIASGTYEIVGVPPVRVIQEGPAV